MPRRYAEFIESRIDDAVRILTHYILMALPDANVQDTQAEMRDIVESIVDAAVLEARK